MVDPGRPQDQAVPIRGLPERGRALCHGFIESVTYAPPSEVAAFAAIVSDHDTLPAERRGRLRVIWLGRHHIPGINAGTELKLEGMLTVKEGMPTMFNPRYEILSRQENQ